ncbi:MAG: DNA repair exonuclease [Lachnospiraceae bacterium]|nr:DNA repair exonuclease [Lachnospiraceae bacterium]
MKIIHCADLHLDSKMTANLNSKKAKERKIELLNTFTNMIKYASDNDVSGIIIAGDLFDRNAVSKTAFNTVLQSITDNPEITFYYLKGNHDEATFLFETIMLPDNLKTFSNTWTSYRIGEHDNIVISGVELSKDNSDKVFNELVLNNDDFNIVTLHGQESDAVDKKDKTEIIPLRSLKNKGIDYLALGHIHSFKEESLDKRGIYCYPGCLEGRGFDECGEHGFVLLDIDEENKTFTREFLPIAKRILYTVNVDITDLNNSVEISNQIREELEHEACPPSSLIKIVLTGRVDAFCDKDVDYLLKQFDDDYYFVKIYDETKLKVSYEDYRLDESLKGEFVRGVMASDKYSEEEKAEIIKYGILLLSGEEV